MGVKDFLSRALLLDEQINSLVVERDHFRSLAENLGGGTLTERVSHSAGSEAPYVKWVERVVDKENEINAKIDRLIAVKLEISDYIGGIENPLWRTLLLRRYLLCKSWPEIAVDMDSSLRTVQRLHKKIMDDLEKKSKNDTG